jgi:hypothetical protein
MHAIINRLPIRPDADWTKLAGKIEEFDKSASSISGEFKGVTLLRASPEEAILFVRFSSREGLDQFSRDVAAPWFAENVRPFLSGAVSRTVCEVVAGRRS